jgi:2-oxoglutarate dehydrogenase complex dehydrogenase (E1) component-like enzyme
MSMPDVDGLNAGFAELLLEEYLGNPDAVPAEWRALFESGADELVASHPGLQRLIDALDARGHGNGSGNGTTTAEPPAAAAAAPAPADVDPILLGGVAAAVGRGKAQRMHGPHAARSRSATLRSSRNG